MSSYKVLLLIFFAGASLAEGNGFLIGGGVEGDTADGLRGSVIGGVGLSEKTWISAGYSKSTVELPTPRDLETVYGDIELDHHFDPVGIRLGVSYWGDSDILDSNDLRGALYWRGSRLLLAAEYERRDFDFTVPRLDGSTSRRFSFDSDGIGLRAGIDLSEHVRLALSGMNFDYSVDFVPIENTDVIDLISASRLSLINSLLDNRASIGLSIDQDLNRWELDFSTWQGVIDRSRTRSLTLRFLAPLTDRTDIEFGLGYDDSERFGDVTFFSLFLYFYGGGA